MLVKKSVLLSILDSLGVDTARQWPDEKLRDKLNEAPGIARFRSAGHTFTEEFLGLTYDDIATATEKGEKIEIEDDLPANNGKDAGALPKVQKPAKKVVKKAPAVKKPVKAKPKAATKPSGNGRPNKIVVKKATAKKPAKKIKKPATPARMTPALYEGMIWKDYVKYLKKNPKKLDLSKSGVMTATYKLLHAAGKKTPKGITKEELHESLVRLFPSNTRKGLWTSVNNNVPSRFMWMYQIEVKSKLVPDRHKLYWIEGTPASVTTGVKDKKIVKAKKKAKAKAGK